MGKFDTVLLQIQETVNAYISEILDFHNIDPYEYAYRPGGGMYKDDSGNVIEMYSIKFPEDKKLLIKPETQVLNIPDNDVYDVGYKVNGSISQSVKGMPLKDFLRVLKTMSGFCKKELDRIQSVNPKANNKPILAIGSEHKKELNKGLSDPQKDLIYKKLLVHGIGTNYTVIKGTYQNKNIQMVQRDKGSYKPLGHGKENIEK